MTKKTQVMAVKTDLQYVPTWENGPSVKRCHHKVSTTTQNMKFTAPHNQSGHLKPHRKSQEIDRQN